MQELVESIKENGVLTPVLVRPTETGYEMISGHRRMHAAQLAGLTTIPAVTRELDDDTATIVMVEANAQREEVLPNEKAFAYKMKYEAVKSCAGRRKKNSPHDGTNFRADETVAEMLGESKNQVYRFMRLTELIPDLLDMVDRGKLTIVPAVEISYLEKRYDKSDKDAERRCLAYCFKMIREKSGMSRTDFSVWLGVPYRTIQEWELGRRAMPEYVLRLIAYKVMNELREGRIG